jgi:hypothetical protein
MVFLGSSVFLAWLAAAALPPLIYWLYRRRKSIVEWSANYILRLTLRQEGRQRRWKVLTILALRVLAILLVVLALARPLWRRPLAPGALPHGPGSLHQVVLVDNSRSLCLPYQAGTREDELRSRLAALLTRTRPGDQCELIALAVPAGERPAAVRVACPASPAQVRAVLDGLRLVERPAAVADALQLAAERFHVTAAQTRHLLWLGDVSRKDGPAPDTLPALRQALGARDVRSVIYEIRDRKTDAPNLALAEARCGPATLFSGWQYHLFLSLRNYGAAPLRSAVSLQFRAGERILDTLRLPLDMEPEEQKLLDFPFVAPQAVEGPVRLRAAITDASYPHDNAREVAVTVRPTARVLLVAHPAEAAVTRPLWRDSRYLESALQAVGRTAADATGPAKNGTGARLARDPVTGQIGYQSIEGSPAAANAGVRPAVRLDVTRVSAEELTAAAVAGADAVVFLGVSRLEPPVRDALVSFVERGGGVLFGLGETVLPDEFNECFAALTPLPLAEPYVGAQRDRPDWEYDAPHLQIEKTFDHALLRRYLDEAEGSIEHVRVYNHFRVRGEANGLMTLSNGDPLLLERAVGRGRVLLFTSTLGGMWNTLPVRNMYVNLSYAWISYLCGFRPLPRNLEAGDALFLEAAGVTNLVIAPPDSAPFLGPLAVRAVDGRRLARCDAAAAAGEYRVLAEGVERDRVLVQEPLFESDTRPFERPDRDRLAGGLGAAVAERWEQVGPALGTDPEQGLHLLGPLILLLLGLLLADAVLTRVWFA